MYKEKSLSECEEALRLAKANFEKICEQHKMFANDSDTEEDIQARIEKSRSSLVKLQQKVENRKRYAKETPVERLMRLKAESKINPHLFSPSLKYTVAAAEKFPPLIPYSSLGNIDISKEGDLILVSNEFNVPNRNRGSLWCFRDVIKNGIPACSEYTKKPQLWVTDWKIDVVVNGFAAGDNTAVGNNSDTTFTGAVHVQDNLVFFANSSAEIGLAKYHFLNDIRTQPLRGTIPKQRVDMAEELCCGLFDTLVKSAHLPFGKSSGTVTAISKFLDARILAGCENGGFSVWDCSTWCRDQNLVLQMGQVTALHAVPIHNSLFVAADKERNMKLFDLRKKNPVASTADLSNDCVISLTSNCNNLMAGTTSGKLLVFDYRKLNTNLINKTYFSDGSSIRSMKFHESNKYIVLASEKEIAISQNYTYLADPFYCYKTNDSVSVSSVAFHNDFCFASENPGRITCHAYMKLLNQNGRKH